MLSNIANNDYPIDIVIPWVDGNDPEWLAEKQKYSPEVNTDTRSQRYRDWDNLQYIFRGIDKFAPWVNNVFFVTWGHLPKWLNTSHPKLRIVNHKDYIPNEYLPTFSTRPIEINFHRIKELSEYFIYFNDDMFLISPTKREDFFKDGKPCDSAILTAISHVEDKYCIISEVRATGILNKYFDSKEVINSNLEGWFSPEYGEMNRISKVLAEYPRFTGIWQHHLPTSLCKSVMIELWEKESGKLHQTSLNKFRTLTDFNQWLFKDWQLATNNFEPRNPFNYGKKFNLVIGGNFDCVKDYVENQKGKVICINDEDQSDIMKNDEIFDRMKREVNQSFDKILPNKSGFEI